MLWAESTALLKTWFIIKMNKKHRFTDTGINSRMLGDGESV